MAVALVRLRWMFFAISESGKQVLIKSEKWSIVLKEILCSARKAVILISAFFTFSDNGGNFGFRACTIDDKFDTLKELVLCFLLLTWRFNDEISVDNVTLQIIHIALVADFLSEHNQFKNNGFDSHVFEYTCFLCFRYLASPRFMRLYSGVKHLSVSDSILSS